MERKAPLVAQMVKNLPARQNTWVRSLDWENRLYKGMATHVSILAWRTPCTEEPGRLQSMGSQRVKHDWRTNWGRQREKEKDRERLRGSGLELIRNYIPNRSCHMTAWALVSKCELYPYSVTQEGTWSLSTQGTLEGVRKLHFPLKSTLFHPG